MKLLVYTQKIDSKDPVLGFFHDWVDRLSYHFDSIIIVCLEKGNYSLPKNVEVFSLRKESGGIKIKYLYYFYKYLFNLSGKYDRVFVHMNQEYVLLGGLYWKIKNIPVYFWRNHSKGNILTDIATYLSSNIFCTSKHSYTAKFAKTIIMPAGIDTSLFKVREGVTRRKYSICMVGRISPVKHIDKGLEVVKSLVDSGVQVFLGIIGPVLNKDKKYFESIKEYINKNNLSSFVSFSDSVSQDKLPEIYNEYQVCLNLTDTGSFDKTIVESAACGTIPLVTNKSMLNLLPKDCIVDDSVISIQNGIKNILDDYKRINLSKDLDKFIKSQSLDSLINKLIIEIKE